MSSNTAGEVDNTTSALNVSSSEPKRKVSILTEPSGHDNPAFEGETRSRKTSQVSKKITSERSSRFGNNVNLIFRFPHNLMLEFK